MPSLYLEESMTPASYGKRVAAYIIDWLIAVVPSIVFLVVGTIFLFSENLVGIGVIFILIGALAWLVIGLWNKVFREGKTGQSVGKSQMNIALVDADTGNPLGAGRCFLREFVAALINSFTFSLFAIIDFLWPLWDPKNQRLMDKIITSQVVVAE
jgi:uncharacterized RDD family membrane protein YckC